MAEISAFSGIRYGGGLDLNELVAPPYDVISPQLQDELYGRDEKNIVRVDFGKEEKGDGEGNNRYTRSAAYIRQWLDEGTLVREDAPALYFYEVDYRTPSGDAKRMTGFICLLRLEEWDKEIVLPHEATLKGPKADRFELMKLTGVSTSQIFSLYSENEKKITATLKQAVHGRPADADATDDDGAHHRVWAVKDQGVIESVRKAMADKKIFIADGHHRYETALAFRNYCREQGPYDGTEGFNYVPMFLANMEEDGLTVLPTHRLVKNLPGLSLERILERASMYFSIDKLPFTMDYEPAQRKLFLESLVEQGKKSHCFGFTFAGEQAYYLLKLKELDPVMEALRCKYSEVYCNLDVTILHELVIMRVLGIDTEMIAESQPVKFEKDGDLAIKRVANGEFDICFLLNATKVREVKEVALAREVMPQKSTYFYPKLLTGLVMAELLPKV